MASSTPRWLLLLHGFTGHPDSWHQVRERLGRELPVFAPALLGHAPNVPDDESVRDFAGEVSRLASWLEQNTSAPGHVCGYSLGARVALGLLVRYPEHFTSATLIGVNPGLSSESERAARRKTDANWQDLLRTRGIEAFARAWQEQSLFESQARLARRALDHQLQCRLAHDAEGLARSLEVLGLAEMPDFLPALREVSIPIELMCGECDTRFIAYADAMRRILPRAQLTRVAGCGHNLPLEAPQAVAATLNRACGLASPSAPS